MLAQELTQGIPFEAPTFGHALHQVVLAQFYKVLRGLIGLSAASSHQVAASFYMPRPFMTPRLPALDRCDDIPCFVGAGAATFLQRPTPLGASHAGRAPHAQQPPATRRPPSPAAVLVGIAYARRREPRVRAPSPLAVRRCAEGRLAGRHHRPRHLPRLPTRGALAPTTLRSRPSPNSQRHKPSRLTYRLDLIPRYCGPGARASPGGLELTENKPGPG